MSDGFKEATLAEALVGMATEESKIRCSDCGNLIDVSEADSAMQVLAVMHRHKEDSHE